MKNKLFILFFAVAFLVLGGLTVSITNVHATVGGPTFIHTFTYNPQDESVYYVEESHSGRGCPPELIKMSLSSGKHQTVFSCDKGEQLLSDGNYDITRVPNEINKIITNFKFLTPIHLKSNKISIDVAFIGTEKIASDSEEIKGATFTASIYQDTKKIADVPIYGCNKDQPFTFAGYAIPGFEKKIVLLVSTKGDCFEGGYTDETLYVVGGIQHLDTKNSINFYKGPSALAPHEGTLVIYEADKLETSVTLATSSNVNPTEDAQKFSILTLIVVALVSVVIGALIGKLSNRK
ncbi:MAG: hypothetical protein K0S38_1066 [Candidatus Paceibacter sp.]|nr:hypothetical protein [Candidatus Paceibacter sp.]